MKYLRVAAMAVFGGMVGLYGAAAWAESAELQMLKQQIHDLEASGIKVPQDMYDLVADAEKREAKKGGGNASNAAGGNATNRSCRSDVAGTYKSLGKDQTVVLNKNGTGSFQQFATNGTYRSNVDFDWAGAESNMTFNYTSDMTYTYVKTGKVEYKKRPKGGTVHCAYYGTSIDIGHVMYYRD